MCGWGLNFGALGREFELENKRSPVELEYFCETSQIHVGHSLYGVNENQELISYYIWEVDNITPTGVKFEKIFGHATNFAIDNSSRIWSWGYNQYKNLGHGSRNPGVIQPKLIKSLENEKVCHASSYKQISACVTESGGLYIWGDCQSLGLSSISLPEKFETDVIAEQAVTGPSWILVLDKFGDVWSLGSSEEGLLGLDQQTATQTLTKINSLKNIAELQAGYNCAAALSKHGQVFVWGYGLSESDDFLLEPQLIDLEPARTISLTWEHILVR